ncbi:MAG TPA: CotH kinase family protein [Verrucomicrobiales bacterium]|nr:CotH kinase family protein [Verrucomicrobiales bacterium]
MILHKAGLPFAAGMLVLATAGLQCLRSPGLESYHHRSSSEVILGKDKITSRTATFLRLGMLQMSPSFCEPWELAADSPAARQLFGQPCPAPSIAALSGPRPPSTELLLTSPNLAPPGVAEVSLVCRSSDLFDERRGIVLHPEEREKASERLAWASARWDSDLVLESPVGLRIHGGSSRGGPMKSFALVFREEYSGHPLSPPGLFFGSEAPPVPRLLLVTAYETSQFNNVLATEIADRLGCRTSRSVPALVRLNGTEIKAPYFLCEHQSPGFVRDHYGMDPIDWKRLKLVDSEEVTESSPEFDDYRRWQRRKRTQVDLAEEARRFDLEDLCAWVLAVTFTATTDSDQGAYFRVHANPPGPWHCLTWDMDGAFNTGIYVYKGREVDCRRQCFETLVGERALLFNRLCQGSSEFREYFRAFVHRKLEALNRETLLEIADRHIAMARSLPHAPQETISVLLQSRSFLARRHQEYFTQLEAWLDKTGHLTPAR